MSKYSTVERWDHNNPPDFTLNTVTLKEGCKFEDGSTVKTFKGRNAHKQAHAAVLKVIDDRSLEEKDSENFQLARAEEEKAALEEELALVIEGLNEIICR